MPMQPEDYVPMAGPLKTRVLELARAYRDERAELERKARALVLCPPDCDAKHPRFPGEHCHTYWDMLRAWEALDYGWRLQQRQREAEDLAKLDVTPHLRRAGVGDVHLRGLAALDQKRPALLAVKQWLGQARPMPRPWLTLLGETDTGKTQAAVAALSHFARRHPWNSSAGGFGGAAASPFLLVHGSEVAEVSRRLRDFAAANGAREREEEFRRAKVLVLDDLGSEKLDADALGLLHSLADYRYRERKATVWTANLNAKAFEQRLDFAGAAPQGEQRGRLWRRIRELGMVAQIERKGGVLKTGDIERPLT